MPNFLRSYMNECTDTNEYRKSLTSQHLSPFWISHTRYWAVKCKSSCIAHDEQGQTLDVMSLVKESTETQKTKRCDCTRFPSFVICGVFVVVVVSSSLISAASIAPCQDLAHFSSLRFSSLPFPHQISHLNLHPQNILTHKLCSGSDHSVRTFISH